MKTIFGTSEKSNFILNMHVETLNKYINTLLTICVVLPLISGLAWLLTDKMAYLPAATLMLSGFIAILLFLVCILKKNVIFQKNISYFLVVGIAVLALICNMVARNVTVSTFGNTGRYEGVFALFSYLGIFLLGSVIASGASVKKVLGLMTAAGLVQSVIAILQMIPALNFPSDFQHLRSTAQDDVFLPSGTAGSPAFLALLLTMFLGIALAGACYEKKTKAKIFYGASSVIFAVVALCTQTLIALVGVGSVFLTMGIIEIIRMTKGTSEKSKLKPILIWLIALVLTAAGFAVLLVFGNYSLKDMGIAYQDSFYNLFVAGTLTAELQNFYQHTWGTTGGIIKMYPFFGTGMDCLYIPQMHGVDATAVKHSFDKCYNDYLYIAGTRGIASLAAYLGLLAVSLKKAFGSLKQFFTNSENWFRAAVAVSVVGYAAAIFFGVSGIMVAPYFFLLLGFANAKKLD